MRKNKKGFTLAELLVVVAVIAVLVAVAIPTFSNQLEKSRQSVDVSNLRGALAAATLVEMDGSYVDAITGEKAELNSKKSTPKKAYPTLLYYDADSGQFMSDTDLNNIKAHGTTGKALSTTLAADLSNLSPKAVYAYYSDGLSTPTINGASYIVADKTLGTTMRYDSGSSKIVAADVPTKNTLPENLTSKYIAAYFDSTGHLQFVTYVPVGDTDATKIAAYDSVEYQGKLSAEITISTEGLTEETEKDAYADYYKKCAVLIQNTVKYNGTNYVKVEDSTTELVKAG